MTSKPSLCYFSSLAERNTYTDESGKCYKEEWCNEYRQLCLKNYDLNMQFFSLSDKNKFEFALESFLKQHQEFEEVIDLSEYADTSGYYMMVLDMYKQVYIGKTENIKRRIMEHWSKTKPFDRILFPVYAYDSSCFSIDFFRALDTTRIFVWKHRLVEGIEDDLARAFPSEFCSNRIGGDIKNAIQAILTMNERRL